MGLIGKKLMKAESKCQACEYEWKHEPGIVICPECEHDKIDWLNFEEYYKWYLKIFKPKWWIEQQNEVRLIEKIIGDIQDDDKDNKMDSE